MHGCRKPISVYSQPLRSTQSGHRITTETKVSKLNKPAKWVSSINRQSAPIVRRRLSVGQCDIGASVLMVVDRCMQSMKKRATPVTCRVVYTSASTHCLKASTLTTWDHHLARTAFWPSRLRQQACLRLNASFPLSTSISKTVEPTLAGVSDC